MKTPTSVWRLKVELLGVVPVVWRRFDTYADVRLSQLHYFIQGAMGWDLMHLFSYQDGHGYGCQISSEALTYTYDFGDNWLHLVTVEKVMVRPTSTYPRRVAGKYACPPEDCGGSWECCGLAMLHKLTGVNPVRVIASHEPGIEPCRHVGNDMLDA